MKKYVVKTYATATWQMIIHADSEEDAEDKVANGEYEYEFNNGHPIDVQDEIIESIVEQPDTIITELKRKDKGNGKDIQS